MQATARTKANYTIGGAEILAGIALVPLAVPLATATGLTILPIAVAVGGVMTAIDGLSRVQGQEGLISEINGWLGTKIPDPVHRLRDKLTAYFNTNTSPMPAEPGQNAASSACTTPDSAPLQPEVPCLPDKPKATQIGK